MPEISVVAISAYLLSLVLLMPGVLRYQRGYRKLALIFAVIALVCHGVAIKSQIFQGAGQNLTLLNLGSVVSLLVSVIMTIVAFQGRAWFLIPIVYSFSMVNLILATLMRASLSPTCRPVCRCLCISDWRCSASRH